MFSSQSDIFMFLVQALTYVWPLLSAVLLVAGILVVRAKLHHSGWAIVVGATLSLMSHLWRISSFLFPPPGGVPDMERYRETMFISTGIDFVGNGLIAYGVLALALVVFRHHREGRFDRPEF